MYKFAPLGSKTDMRNSGSLFFLLSSFCLQADLLNPKTQFGQLMPKVFSGGTVFAAPEIGGPGRGPGE